MASSSLLFCRFPAQLQCRFKGLLDTLTSCIENTQIVLRPSISLPCCCLVIFCCSLVISIHALTVVVHLSQIVLPNSISLIRGQFVQFSRLLVRLINTDTMVVLVTQHALRPCFPFLNPSTQLLDCLFI
jgi:hypothetical protein